MVHFWTRIRPGPGDGYRFGSEAWDDGNTGNSDGCKTLGSDGETSNYKIIKNDTNKSFITKTLYFKKLKIIYYQIRH